jgi:hypothetical protein
MANFVAYPPQQHRLPLTALSPGVKAAVSLMWLLVTGAWVTLLALTASAPNAGSAVVIAVAVAAVAASLPLTFLLVEALRSGRGWRV